MGEEEEEEKSERFSRACLSSESEIRDFPIVTSTETQCFTEGPADNAV